MLGRWLLIAVLLTIPSLVGAGEPKKVEKANDKQVEAKPVVVPYRLTDTNHTLVRVKINGKGPFNFIVDTGCPVLLISEPVGEKLGLEKGAAILDKMELEGGLEMTKVKAQIETPFQIKGMNKMGLAGVELHGLMGFTVLAKYKMDIDYTQKQMLWTPLAFDPPPPVRLGGKAATGGMDTMVALVEILSFLSGMGPAAPPQGRGFCGFEMTDKNKEVLVSHVLPKGPAAVAGLKVGDRIVQAEGKDVQSVSDVLRRASKLAAGKTLRLNIERDQKKQELKITAGEGL